MTGNVEGDAEGVKTIADVRELMARVKRRFTKAHATKVIADALGCDPISSKAQRPDDLEAFERVRACAVLEAALKPRLVGAQPEPQKPTAPPSVPERLAPADDDDLSEELEFVSEGAKEYPRVPLLPLGSVMQFDHLPAQSITDVCNRWVWVRGMKRFIRRTDPSDKIDVMQFDSEYNMFVVKSPSISKALFKTNRIARFARSDFRPGADEFDGEVYNVWRPSPIVPVPGDTSLWNAHINWLIPNETDRNHFLDWLAWVLQNPTKMPGYGLLLVGQQVGTGKSFVARVMEQIIGEVNTQRPKNSSLKGDFNPWIAMCRLCLIEELNQIGKREVAHELRDLITEPTCEVNQKNVNQYTIKNHAAIMSISNYPDALPIDQGDRRWLVVESPLTEADKIAAVEDGHFARLMPIVEPDKPNIKALAAIAHELMTRDVRHFRQGDAPMTEAKAEMIDLSRNTLETWLADNIGNDPLTRTIVNMRDDIIEAIPDSIRRDKSTTRVEATVRKFCKAKLGAVKLGTYRVGERKGSKTTKVVQLWAMNGGPADDDIVARYEAERDAAGSLADREAANDFGE
jgi:hypothetical protein